MCSFAKERKEIRLFLRGNCTILFTDEAGGRKKHYVFNIFQSAFRRSRLQITIYLDVVFLINFLAIFSILMLTDIVLKQKTAVWRILAGSVLGAGVLLPFLFFPYYLIGKTGVIVCAGISLGTVKISFKRGNGCFLKQWVLSTTNMILLGGVMNYLKQITGKTTLQLGIWFALFVGSSLFCFLMVRFFRITGQKENNIYWIKIKKEKQMATDKVFLDTGNMLWDALYGKPVILLSEEFVRQCLTAEEREMVETYKENGQIDYEKMMSGNTQKTAGFHEIAYQSVGNSSGKLLCFLIEEIEIQGCNKILRKQPVAIGPAYLFKGKEYQGLLHVECI